MASNQTVDDLLGECQRLAEAGRLSEAITKLTRAAEADGHPAVLFMLGNYEKAAGRTKNAAKRFRAVLHLMPEAPEPRVNLANSLTELGAYDEAEKLLREGLQRQPDSPDLLFSLAVTAGFREDWEQAEVMYRRILDAAPDYPNAVANLAETLSRLRRYDEAEPLFRSAIASDPDNPAIRYNFSKQLLEQGRTGEGWRYNEARLEPSNPEAAKRNLSVARWQGEPLDGKCLLICTEQGLGDELRFSAYFKRLARSAKQVLVETDPRLLPLYRRSLPEIEFHEFYRRKSGRSAIYSYGWLRRDAMPDYFIEICSLPLLLEDNNEAVEAPAGHLVPDPDRVAELAPRLSELANGQKLVGLTWTSGLVTAIRASSYAPIEAWAPLFALTDVAFVAMQYGDSKGDLEAFEQAFGRAPHWFEDLDLRNDLETLAALASLLDCEVAMSTATSVMCGAVGTPTIEVIPFPDWAPFIGDRDALIGPIRRVLPDRNNDWVPAFASAADMLRATLAGDNET
ncbi:MAG: tetratricopeptide repeat protein [Rhodospirillaceae bacterium]|nr:tetratricopeptide repeat protein [Rhodospirillaceae bacterium]